MRAAAGARPAGPRPSPVADQGLTQRPSRGRKSAAPNRIEVVNGFTIARTPMKKADKEQRENAALDQGHPRGRRPPLVRRQID